MVLLLAPLTSVATLPAGCGTDPGAPTVTGVSPARAFTDDAVILRVGTAGVRPGLSVDVTSGSFDVDLQSLSFSLDPDADDGRPRSPLETVKWDGDQGYWVRSRAGLAGGRYALTLADPGGHTSSLADAFEALGPDPDPPSINVAAPPPGGFVGAGTVGGAQISVSDGLGQLASVLWNTSNGHTGDCLPPNDPLMPPPSTVTCTASFTVPALSDQDPAIVPFSLSVEAADVAGNQAALEVPLNVAKLPVIDSFSGLRGSLGGGQPFVVHGRYFLPGSRALIDDLPIIGSVDGGDVIDDQTITGFTPPHDRPESVFVKVKSPAGSMTSLALFTYAPPPRPRDIQPTTGPPGGGILVTVVGNDLGFGVVVYVGSSVDDRQALLNPKYDVAGNKIVGCLPPGSGTASIWTYDQIRGDGELPNAFTYQDPLPGTNAPAVNTDCQTTVP